MPLEFSEEPVEPRDSSRRRLIAGAVAALLGAALIGAAGVYATIALLNAFAGDTVDGIRNNLTCQRFEAIWDGSAPDDLLVALEEFRAEYGAPFMPTPVTVDEDGNLLIADLTPARDGDELVIVAPTTALETDESVPEAFGGFRVETCLPAAGSIPPVDQP